MTAALLLAATLAAAPPADGTILERTPVETGDKPFTLEKIVYASSGLKVAGYLAVPAQGDKLPCVIVNRGGNRDFGAFNDRMAANQLGALATHGYIVVASNLRGSPGSEGADEFGGADVNDVLALLPLLDALPRADAKRIGMTGWSRGGLETYLVLARTDRIKAAVIGGGLTDSFDEIARRPEMERETYSQLVPRWDKERDAQLAARSPVRWVAKLAKSTPLLLLHGTADWRVDPHQALKMSEALLEAKHPFRLVMLEGGDHGLTEYADEVGKLTLEWLDAYVRDGKAWPSLERHGY